VLELELELVLELELELELVLVGERAQVAEPVQPAPVWVQGRVRVVVPRAGRVVSALRPVRGMAACVPGLEPVAAAAVQLAWACVG
jgi:hypothetical protein